MGKKSMYESQSSGCPDYSGSGRDAFVVGYVSGLAKASADVPRIAELSVGSGALSKALVQALPKAEFTFADISSANLKVLESAFSGFKAQGVRGPRLIECDFDTQFSLLEDAAFDVVIALDILEHVFDVFAFIGNCRRILKPGATLILRTPNIGYIRHRLGLLAGGLPVTSSWFGKRGELGEWRKFWSWDGGHLHLFTIPVLRQLISEEGFSIELCRDPGTKWESVRGIWPNLMYSNPLIVARNNKGNSKG
ncbi:MAG: hypothetical protein A2049_04750 [Elusimicrobia bacterium GWA2_62_23]|nr:MAG: hypothetical protein A2049_04750 [Elusimicrobia bacterium GWA2_62_23]